MMPTIEKMLILAFGMLLAAAFGCFVAAGLYDHRRFALSGIPSHHFGVNENGRFFYVSQGGPPVDQRPQFAISAEQYHTWEDNDRLSNDWAQRAALCVLAMGGIGVWRQLSESKHPDHSSVESYIGTM
ncbi:MAG: hypothetical protein ACJ8FY_12250 [Gemmataceae bacterium]